VTGTAVSIRLHGNGRPGALNACASLIFLLPVFDPVKTLGAIETHPLYGAYSVPTMFNANSKSKRQTI